MTQDELEKYLMWERVTLEELNPIICREIWYPKPFAISLSCRAASEIIQYRSCGPNLRMENRPK